MKHKILAILAVSALLLSGCSKMTEVTSSNVSDPAGNSVTDSQSDSSAQDADASTAEGETQSGSDASGSENANSAADPKSKPAEQTAPPEGADNDQEGDYGTAPAQETQNPGTPVNADAKLFITVETAEVTVDQLKAQDYTVPLIINLDKNPGINYSEWGLMLDDRCTYTTDSKGLDFSTVSYINDEKHFLWTAWTSGAEVADYDGSLLKLNVKLPLDAKAGDTYTIRYASTSLADGSHIWSDGDNDWVAANAVGWQDGGVIVK